MPKIQMPQQTKKIDKKQIGKMGDMCAFTQVESGLQTGFNYLSGEGMGSSEIDSILSPTLFLSSLQTDYQ